MDVDEIMVVDEILHDQEEAEIQANAPPRQFLPRLSPFVMLSEGQFIKYFRVSKVLAHTIIESVMPFVAVPSRTSALSVETKVLIALRFFGFGSYQEITGTNIFTGVRQSSVSRCIEEICNILGNPEIFNQWVRFPRNIAEMETLRRRFYEKYNLPGIVGAIDCTHVAIVAPPSDNDRPEHIYVNRKNYHSINVQLICDDNLKILNVNARFPGSCHDAHIWRQSNVAPLMERIYREDPTNLYFLIGDLGYPLRPWLMTPVRGAAPNSPEERFNQRFSEIRSIIERCNGVLKNRFRCLLKHRVLHYKPEKAGKIINACVVLHNMCIQNNIPLVDENDDNVDMGLYGDAPEELNADRFNPDLAAATQIQRNIIQRLFV